MNEKAVFGKNSTETEAPQTIHHEDGTIVRQLGPTSTEHYYPKTILRVIYDRRKGTKTTIYPDGSNIITQLPLLNNELMLPKSNFNENLPKIPLPEGYYRILNTLSRHPAPSIEDLPSSLPKEE